MGKLSFLGQVQRKLLGTTIPVINIHGTIQPQTTALVEKRLKKINTDRAVALAVSVNSPGGLPVQSQLICNKIKHFAHQNHLQIYTFAQDMAASGGYFILSIGNHVYADRTSIVGSIGVVFSKLHLKGLLQSTSIDHKNISSNKKLLTDIMNPFSPLQQHNQQYLENICKDTHSKFIQHVKTHRGNKIKIDDRIFSGEVYNGEQAVQNGLVDQVGTMIEVLDKKFPGSKLDIYNQPKSMFNSIRSII